MLVPPVKIKKKSIKYKSPPIQYTENTSPAFNNGSSGAVLGREVSGTVWEPSAIFFFFARTLFATLAQRQRMLRMYRIGWIFNRILQNRLEKYFIIATIDNFKPRSHIEIFGEMKSSHPMLSIEKKKVENLFPKSQQLSQN